MQGKTHLEVRAAMHSQAAQFCSSATQLLSVTIARNDLETMVLGGRGCTCCSKTTLSCLLHQWTSEVGSLWSEG